MKRKIILILSGACFAYFFCLIFISYKQITPPVFFGALIEMFTIPTIILLPVLLFISFRGLYMDKWSVKSCYIISILIQLATLALICVATFSNW